MIGCLWEECLLGGGFLAKEDESRGRRRREGSIAMWRRVRTVEFFMLVRTDLRKDLSIP